MARSTDRCGFIYVLCFHKHFKHARHYIGCTENLKERLTTHAQGRGANIVKHAVAEGIGFTLGALGQCTLTTLRKLERQAKSWKNAEQFCDRCRGEQARKIPGTTPVCVGPAEQNAFDSAVLWPASRQHAPVELSSTNERITYAEVEAIRKLAQLNKHALGFIPAAMDSTMIRDLAAGRCIVATEAGVIVGYCYYTETETSRTIHQCVVADALRGDGIGRRMVNRVCEEARGLPVGCKVRDSLAAVGFWPACGFRQRGDETHETSGERLLRFVHVKEAESCSS